MDVRFGLFLLPLLAACAADTFTTADASADASAETASGIQCGASPCALSETCCVTTDGGGGSAFACHATCPSPQNGNGAAALGCISTADCTNGAICCMHQASNVSVSACQTQCGSSDVILCDPTVDGGCAGAEPCSSSNINEWRLPPTFGTCGGRAVP